MKTRLVVPAILVCIASTLAVGQQVSVNYNPNEDFSRFRTYAWAPNNAKEIQNSILGQVAQQDINSALQSKGLQMVQESQNPDLIVASNGGAKQVTSYQAWATRGWAGGMGQITPQQNLEGTLIVDLYDAKNKSLAWRGIAQSTLSNKGSKNTKMVGKAIEKMFKKYPSPSKG